MSSSFHRTILSTVLAISCAATWTALPATANEGKTPIEAGAPKPADDVDARIDQYREELARNPSKRLRKELKQLLSSTAEKLAAKGAKLEQKGDLKAAKDAYIDAQSYYYTATAQQGLNRIDKADRKEAKAALQQAQGLYESRKYQEAADLLRAGLENTSSPGAFYWNLALCHYRLGDKLQALQNLDQYIGNLPDGKKKREVREFRTMVATGADSVDLNGSEKTALKRLNRQLNSKVEGEEIEPGKDEEAAAVAGADDDMGLCSQLEQVYELMPNHPAVVFNLAKCAEAQGHGEEAMAFFDKYLELSPEAADAEEVELRKKDLKELLALAGETAGEIRLLFAEAGNLVEDGDFQGAIERYRKAAELAPDHPLPIWKLALIHEALGEVEEATRYFVHYESIAANPEQKELARVTMEKLEGKMKSYSELVATANEGLNEIVRRNLSARMAGGSVNTIYARRELSRISTPLQEALALFPLGQKANQLMGFVFQQGNNHSSARRSFDALKAHGREPAFFTKIYTEPAKKRILARVSFGSGEIKIRSLASYDPSQKAWQQNWKESAIEDVLWSEAVEGLEEKRIPLDSVRRIATKAFQVLIESGGTSYYLTPFYISGEIPASGPAARQFGNNYTRLFRRYAEFEDIHLGKEKLTAGEIFGMVLGAATASLGSYALATSASNAYNSTQTLMNYMQVAMDTFGAYQRYALEQRQMVQQSDFKILPVGSVQLDFIAAVE